MTNSGGLSSGGESGYSNYEIASLERLENSAGNLERVFIKAINKRINL